MLMEAHPENTLRELNVRRDQFWMLKDSFANYVTNNSEKSLVYYGSVCIEAKVSPTAEEEHRKHQHVADTFKLD